MANLNFNRAIIAGRLTAEPELRQTQSGFPVVTFTVAVNRRFVRSQDNNAAPDQPQQQTADFISVVAWRDRAEFVSRYFHKGSSIFVMGSIQTRTWTDQQNVKHYMTEISADEINFVDSKNENAGYQNYGQAPAYSQGFAPAPTSSSQQPAQSTQSAPKADSKYTPDNYNPVAYVNNAPQKNSSSGFEELGDDENLPF